MKNLNKIEINIVGGGVEVKMIEWFTMHENGIEFYQAGCLKDMPIEMCDKGAAILYKLFKFGDIPNVNSTKTIVMDGIEIKYHIGLPA